MRKISTVQEISEILEIPGADRIVIAKMQGVAWNVIVGKDQFKPGDKVAYFETDSVLPEEIEAFAEFQKRGQNTITHEGKEIKGHVLRTVKLRGVFSQGLIMPLSVFGVPEDTPVGTDIIEFTKVFKFEEPLPNNSDIIGPFDNRFAPKTDAERVQNLAEFWDEIKGLDWDATVKVDGTSQTLVYDEGFRIFGRNWELDPATSLGFKVMPREVLDVLEADPGLTVQFELAGPGINGNRLKLSKPTVFIFSVWKDRVKVPRSQWDEAFLANSAPEVVFEISGSIDEMLSKVAKLRGNVSKDLLDEGIVLHLKDSVGDVAWLDGPGVVKFISNGYLLKHGL